MKSTHHTIRAISLGIGLALLVVSGTAAMIGAFSAPVTSPGATSGLSAPLLITPVAGTPSHSGDDSVLYERVARSDGRSQWVLVEEPATSVAALSQQEPRASLASLAIAGNVLRPVSYSLQGKPVGLNKVLRNCNSTPASNGTKSKANGAYDLSCATLS